MTEQKSLKRRVRSRMEKTGERYTAARAHVLAEAPGPEPEPFDAEAIGLVSDETIAKRTGRSWADWVALLDEWDATSKTHAEIARHVNEELGVPGWWAQTVTVGYERARGLRALHQRPDGFSVTASKTVAVPVERLFAAVTDPDWPEPGALRPRTAQPARSARFDWQDTQTRVVLWLEAKGEAKSTVALEHAKLPDALVADELKRYWRERLAGLKVALEEQA
jgi:hypothetical protein